MKRMLALLTVCLMLCAFLWVPASAAANNAASGVDLVCTVNSDGDCFVTMTVLLRLESPLNQLSFPLPAGARDVTMNGSNVSTSPGSSALDVDISRITRDYVGEARIQFAYTLPEAVKVIREDSMYGQKGELQLTLPMLSGFDLPVESLKFTITMPGTAEFSPRFISTYMQQSAASGLTVVKDGTQIIGSSSKSLNDHEGLTMTMIVPQKMFPSVRTFIREGNPEIIPMAICAGIALLYWLLFLFNKPMRPTRTSTPPEGITAGEMGCRLTLAGADLTTMVFTWAQLGYVLLHLDGNGRVLVNKRMEMGNERSAFENKVFRMLFGNRRTIDATGNQYAQLCGKVATLIPSEKTLYLASSGNMKFFRYLCCGIQMFCGVNVAMNMSEVPPLQILMSVILVPFGAVTAWMIQEVAYRTHLRGKTRVYVGMVCFLLWILLGVLCGQVWIPLVSSLGQWLLGYFAAYGGRRSDLGRHDAGLVLGFRRYVRKLPREDIGRLLAGDPDYFFNLVPYVLALGMIGPFGRIFGRRKLDQCPYLITPIHGKRTGEEWAKLIARTADMMDAKARRMQIEKLIPFELPKISIQFTSQPKKKRRR